MNVLMWLSIGLDRRTPSEHLLCSIIESLCEEGHSVHILQKNTGGSLPVIPTSVKNLSITTEIISCRMPKKTNFISRYLSDIRYVYKCKKKLKNKCEFDVVFLQSNNVAGFITPFIKKKMKLPVLYNVQDIFPYNALYSGNVKKNGLIFKVLRKIQSKGYESADKIVTISEDMKQQLIEDGVSKDKIDVVYNWSYQDSLYEKESLDLRVANSIFDQSKFNVLYAGNIGMMQNVDILIGAANYLRDDKNIMFHIVGDGLYKEKLIKRSAILNLKNIKFWDMQDSSIAPSLYCSANINIIPLAKNIFKTALPSKTATCLACNRPVVFCIGEESILGKKLSEQTGCYLINSDDYEELARIIKEVMHNDNQVNFFDVFNDNFSKMRNSKKYVNYLVRLVS